MRSGHQRAELLDGNQNCDVSLYAVLAIWGSVAMITIPRMDREMPSSRKALGCILYIRMSSYSLCCFLALFVLVYGHYIGSNPPELPYPVPKVDDREVRTVWTVLCWLVNSIISLDNPQPVVVSSMIGLSVSVGVILSCILTYGYHRRGIAFALAASLGSVVLAAVGLESFKAIESDAVQMAMSLLLSLACIAISAPLNVVAIFAWQRSVEKETNGC